MRRIAKAEPPGLRRFIARRRARVATWAMLGASVGVIAGLTEPSAQIGAAWHYVASAEGSEYLTALLWFGLWHLLPFLVLMLVAGLLFGAMAGAVGVAAALLPRRIGIVIDGVALAGTVMALMQMLQVSAAIRTLPAGTLLDLLSIWLMLISLSGVVWNRLPGGMSHRSRVARVVDIPIDQARDRLIPHRAAGVELADLGIGAGAHDVPKDWQPVTVHRETANTWRLDEPERPVPWRQMRYRLTEPEPGKTRIEVDIALHALSPLAWWDVATRPFGLDFLDHVEARLLRRTDRSSYGQLAMRSRKSAQKALHRASRKAPLGQPLATPGE